MNEALCQAIPLWMCIPFVGMLLSIALFPLFQAEWWEKHQPWVVAFWSLLFLIPFAVQFGTNVAFSELLSVLISDYLTFIILLFGLFCVAGNISLEGDLAGHPKTNIILLLIGTLLASFIGTTGASMVMIRPMIHANQWRKRKTHVFVFFIFLVSNIGGCLLPMGDPPLLMGYIHGVNFLWSLKLFPVLLVNVVLLLGLFAFNDIRAYLKDSAEGVLPSKPLNAIDKKLHVKGLHNLFFLAIIVAAVILNGVLPQISSFWSSGITFTEDVTLTYSTILEIVLILLSAFLSFKTTHQSVREYNQFTMGAIKEVAILFIGIFITMVPALMYLNAKGANLGLTHPWQYFWATGALSSFLDNTPTYLVFFTTAASLGAASGVITSLGPIAENLLLAISCGAIFMGANTYIGNAPNFMVRSIVEENGIKMPSFFGYMWWSIRYLIPVFIIDTLIFFL